MESRFRFLLFRLRHARGSDFYSLLDEILSRPENLDAVSIHELAVIVQENLEKGWLPSGSMLARLAVLTNSEHLIAECRHRLLQKELGVGDIALLLDALGARDGLDEIIESRLCEILYEIRRKDDDPKRREIVRVLGKFGANLALAVLKEILSEVEPSAKVTAIFADALQTGEYAKDFSGVLQSKLAAFEASARSRFVQELKSAITAIEMRLAD